MLTFVLLAALMCIVTLVLLTRPLWPSFASGSVHHVGDEVARLGQQNKQLRELHAAGALTDEAFASAKALVETKLLATVLDANPSATLARRSTSALGGAMVVFVAAVVGAGYYGLGSPASLALGPDSSLSGASRDEAARGGDAEVEGAAHPITTEQITSMVEKLAERLKQQPDDGDGWFMLARSYAAIGKHPEAVDAFKQAARLLPEDASLLSDYADALAVVNHRSLDGEPSKLVARALKIDPDNSKALLLAGTAAFDRKDYEAALGYWERGLKSEPTDSDFARQLKGNIDEARQLAGGGVPRPSTRAPESAEPSTSATSVSGTVTLSPAFADKVAPDDTVFVFARAVNGPPMPLAILRKQVKDLPIQFTLDDSMAMAPSAMLSKYAQAVVGARVSKSGNAIAQNGDLQGLTAAIAVGSTGLRLEINEAVQK